MAVRGRQKQRPRFFWSGVLIVMPVAVLAAFGAVSLSRDRALTDSEARERASEFANRAAEHCARGLASPNLVYVVDLHLVDGGHAVVPPSAEAARWDAPLFLVSPQGRLLFPAPVAAIPFPANLDPAQLEPAQAQIWRQIESGEVAEAGAISQIRNRVGEGQAIEAEVADVKAASQIEFLRNFLKTNPKAAFAALAHFRLGVLLRRTDRKQAMEECQLVMDQFPDAVGETGLPLAPLAALQWLEMVPPSMQDQPAAIPSGPEKSHSDARVQAVRDAKAADENAAVRVDGRARVAFDSRWVNAVPARIPPVVGNAVIQSNLTGLLKEPDLGGALNQLGSNAVARPGLMTPLLLNELAEHEQRWLNTAKLAAFWRRIWNRTEMNRRMFGAARESLGGNRNIGNETAEPERLDGRGRLGASAWPPVFWFHGPEPPAKIGPGRSAECLAIRYEQKADGSAWFLYRNREQVQSLLAQAEQVEQALPNYLGVLYQLGGRSFGGTRWRQGVGAAQVDPQPRLVPTEVTSRTKLLASVAGKADDGTPLVTVSVALLDPAALYARQRQRVLWFGGLIALSALVSLIGLLSTWSAFQRQQRLYEMQTNFVSSVSHELRAPIGTVRLLAENLKRGKVPEPAEQHRFFDYIVQECSRLSSMIENVLNLARIEQGRKEYEFEPKDMVRLVSETIRLMEPNAAEHGVSLVSQFQMDADAEKGVAALVDGGAIQQALINLIDNAIKHSPPNSTVTVGLDLPAPTPTGTSADSACRTPHSALGSTSPSAMVGLWIEDHGPGIPPEEQQKIFERFYRRGSELRRETPGVGIGLSIVKHIAEAHGGRVIVQSAVGQGSRFTLQLPVGRE